MTVPLGTWIGLSSIALLLLLGWSSPAVANGNRADWKGPRDRFWRHHVEEQSLLFQGVEYYETIQTCLNTHLTPEERRDIETTKADQRGIGFQVKDEYRHDKVVLMVVERAIAPLHVKAVQSLAACVRTIFPQLYEARSFYVELGLEKDEGMGGNNPTHLAPLVSIFFPSVVDEIQETIQLAYDTAGWSYYHRANQTQHRLKPRDLIPSPSEIGFRASEHLTYTDFKEGLASHTDGADTFFTVNFAFSGPQDYDGGFFYLKYGQGDLYGHGIPPRETIYLKPNKYDCLVFLGGPYLHGVTEMTGGNREMYSSEMWNYPDTPFGSTLWMNVADRMAQYIRLCNQEQANNMWAANGACQVNMTNIKTEEDLREEASAGGPPSQWKDASSGTSLSLLDCLGRDKERFFLLPRQELQPGETRTIYWREDGLPLDDSHGKVVGLPPQLTTSLYQYLNVSGWFDQVRSVLYPLPHQQATNDANHQATNRILQLQDQSQWKMEALSRRPLRHDPTRRQTDMVRLEPVDYTAGNAHALVEALTHGDFAAVLPSLTGHWSELMKSNPNTTAASTTTTTLPFVGVTRLQVVALTYAEDAGPSDESEIVPHFEDTTDHVRLVIPIYIPEHRRVRLGLAQREGNGVLSWGELHLRTNVGIAVSGRALYEPANIGLRRDAEWQVWMVVTLGRRQHTHSTSPQQQQDEAIMEASPSSTTSFVWSATNHEAS